MSDPTRHPHAIEDAAAAPAAAGPPALPVGAAIRFCRRCGAAWDPLWTSCGNCAAGIAPAAAPPDAAAAGAGVPDGAADYASQIKWVKSSVGLYFALLAICLSGAVVAAVSDGGTLTAEGDIVLSSLLAAVAVGWCAAGARHLRPVLRAPSPGWYPVAAVAACATYLIATGLVRLLVQFANMPTVDYADAFQRGGYGFGWVVAFVCVMPGVFEELAFRGFIQTALQNVIGPYEAVFVSALMFAILHVSIPSLPHLALMGVALGFLRLKTASVYPGMLMHFTHNLLVVLSERSGGVLPW